MFLVLVCSCFLNPCVVLLLANARAYRQFQHTLKIALGLIRLASLSSSKHGWRGCSHLGPIFFTSSPFILLTAVSCFRDTFIKLFNPVSFIKLWPSGPQGLVDEIVNWKALQFYIINSADNCAGIQETCDEFVCPPLLCKISGSHLDENIENMCEMYGYKGHCH